MEQSFEGHWPAERINKNKEIRELEPIDFYGKGIVVCYSFTNVRGGVNTLAEDYIAEVEVSLDGEIVETVKLPVAENARKQELFYKYKLEEKDHRLSFKWLNATEDGKIYVTSYIPYVSEPSAK